MDSQSIAYTAQIQVNYFGRSMDVLKDQLERQNLNHKYIK